MRHHRLGQNLQSERLEEDFGDQRPRCPKHQYNGGQDGPTLNNGDIRPFQGADFPCLPQELPTTG